MLKFRLIAALAIGSLALSPAMARDTRSSQTVPPPAKSKGSEVSQERLAQLFPAVAASCDAPGNGQKTGHENSNGQGHIIGRGKGHACDGKSPG
jgi:hypothetical protein